MSLSTKDLVEAELDGKWNQYTWRKVPNQISTQGIWFDLSMSAGMPVPQYYAATPLTATVMSFSSDRGIFHGYDVAPDTKYLRMTVAQTATATALPMDMYLLDYLMYYPFVDEGTTDPQDMDNTNTLTRYTDGVGVQVMAVSQGSRTGGQQFNITYTNSDGVSGRVSPNVTMNTATANGSIITSATATSFSSGPFIPLQEGDTGVRSIEQVTMLGPDVGLFALVLVKPLAQTQIREITAVNEKDYLLQGGVCPEIKNDAYLNWICLPNGSLSGSVVYGDLKVLWA